jgi:hypothetical protein
MREGEGLEKDLEPSAEAATGCEARLEDLPMEGLDSPGMVQAFKDLNTLHPDFASPARDAVLRIFMWCRRADAILKARSAPEAASAGGSHPTSHPLPPNLETP